MGQNLCLFRSFAEINNASKFWNINKSFSTLMSHALHKDNMVHHNAMHMNNATRCNLTFFICCQTAVRNKSKCNHHHQHHPQRASPQALLTISWYKKYSHILARRSSSIVSNLSSHNDGCIIGPMNLASCSLCCWNSCLIAENVGQGDLVTSASAAGWKPPQAAAPCHCHEYVCACVNLHAIHSQPQTMRCCS